MPDDLLASVSLAATPANDLEELARPLLDVLRRVSGLEAAYLTQIHWERDEQEVLFLDNRGGPRLEERQLVPWQDALCRRALESDVRATSNVASTFPNAPIGDELKIRTYMMAPVVTPDSEVFGTLCAVGSESKETNEDVMQILDLFARLIADQVAREQALQHHRDRAEAAEAKLRARARFLAEAEHKLKTPLTIVAGWSHLLENKWNSMPEDRRMQGITVMRESSQRLAEHINRMLHEAQAEVLTSELQLVSGDARPILDDAALSFDGVSERHHVELRSDAHLPAIFDKAALRQVLGHLIENAIKYSPAGGTITIRATTDDRNLVVEVSDEGIGIPEGVDLFQAFSRGDAAEETEGVGLGLHIVRNLVESMNGSVSARRNPERGSSFEVRLPRSG